MSSEVKETAANYISDNQLVKLQQFLQKQSKPLFQEIEDSQKWQKRHIAATARIRNCILVTRNIADFAALPDVMMMDPFDSI